MTVSSDPVGSILQLDDPALPGPAVDEAREPNPDPVGAILKLRHPGEPTERGGPGPAPEPALRLLRRIGVAVFVAQFVGLAIWTHVLYARFALTYDFATYLQSVWEIWHGHMNPYNPILGFPLWGNGGQALFWLLAFVTWPFRSGITLLWLQDAAVAGIGLVVFWWITELLRDNLPRRRWMVVIGGLAIVALAANPWVYWSASFDIHSETFCTFFLVLAARSLYYRRWTSLAVWSALTVTGGLVECTYIAALGLGALLLGKRYLKPAALLIGLPMVYFFALEGPLHAQDLPPPGIVYGYLAGPSPTNAKLSFLPILVVMITHPWRVVRQIWVERANFWANVAPGGVVGLFSRWTVAISAVVLGTDLLSRAFASVPFQNLPISVFVTVGTVMLLIRWTRLEIKGRRLGRHLVAGISALMLVSSLGWSYVWSSRVSVQWLRTSPQASAVLARALATIPASDEVVVSQGVSGPFAQRHLMYVTLLPVRQSVPLLSHHVWFVVTPNEGIELTPPAFSDSLVQQLVVQDHARLVFHQDDVWVAEVTVPEAQLALADRKLTPSPVLTFGAASTSTLDGWLVPGPAGTSHLVGPESTWYTESTGARGYVTAHAYWGEQPGTFEVRVSLATRGPVNVELWDVTTNQLLLRRTPPSTDGHEQSFAYSVTTAAQSTPVAYSGWGPFQVLPIEPTADNVLEVRVWSPGRLDVKVFGVTFRRLTGSGQ